MVTRPAALQSNGQKPLPIEARGQQRQAQRLAVQYRIAKAFASADSLEEISGLVLRTLVDTLDWRAAGIWVLDDESTQLRCIASHPTEGPLGRWAEHSRALRLPIGAGLPGRVWASGQSHWIADTDSDENFPRRAIAREVGLGHGFAFGIRVGGAIAAVVELLGADASELDQDEAAFLEAYGHQLGSFIERVEARRAVAHSEAQKSAILDAAVDAIVSADAGGRIIEFNHAAEALFGRRREDVLGQRIADVLVPEDLRAQHVAGLERYLATGEARVLGQRVRVRALRADGSTMPVELTITETRVNERPSFTAFLRDITGQREAEVARDRFLEILSHELRTPVTAIYAGAKLASRGSLRDAQHAEVLQDVAAEADRLYRLVEDLMVVARAERGTGPLVLEPVNVARLTERVVAAVQTASPVVEFRLRIMGAGPPVQGDETYVEQLLRNLLINAAKYAASGRVVDVEVDPGEIDCTVRVLDRGPGIGEGEAERLFEIDYRSPRTQSSATGSGIGLFVARWLVESMGGRIWARPREGGGSEFGFSLLASDVTGDGDAPETVTTIGPLTDPGRELDVSSHNVVGDHT
ncbi:MAG TPA: GAF domain-containing sensor histidine kinase [Candidatus Limnocylindria bacterium]|nr:GAF domain-containing sensor histidine kinase [Candidatus Limnocylindria bacterium]